MAAEKRLDCRNCVQHAPGKLGQGSLANDHQQCDTVPDDRGLFVRLVADATIMTECNPLVSSDLFQPVLIGTVRRKEVGMPAHVQPACAEDIGKLLAQIAVGEIDPAQAARS